MKDKFSQLEIGINGEIKDLNTVIEFIDYGMDGCMIGREVI